MMLEYVGGSFNGHHDIIQSDYPRPSIQRITIINGLPRAVSYVYQGYMNRGGEWVYALKDSIFDLSRPRVIPRRAVPAAAFNWGPPASNDPWGNMLAQPVQSAYQIYPNGSNGRITVSYLNGDVS